MGVTSRMSREAHVRSLWAAGGEIPPADPIALEEDTGSAVSYWQDGAPGPRTSQDLAYGQLGMAMYYYLTRDESVLADILRLKEHIFGGYWNAEWGMLRWVAKGDP
jgi:hypothetical protein